MAAPPSQTGMEHSALEKSPQLDGTPVDEPAPDDAQGQQALAEHRRRVKEASEMVMMEHADLLRRLSET